MKPQRFWAVVDENGRVLPQHGHDGFENGYLRCSLDRSALVPGNRQRVVRLEVRIVEPKKPAKRKARKGAK